MSKHGKSFECSCGPLRKKCSKSVPEVVEEDSKRRVRGLGKGSIKIDCGFKINYQPTLDGHVQITSTNYIHDKCLATKLSYRTVIQKSHTSFHAIPASCKMMLAIHMKHTRSCHRQKRAERSAKSNFHWELRSRQILFRRSFGTFLVVT